MHLSLEIMVSCFAPNLVQQSLGDAGFIQECDCSGGKVKAHQSFGAAWFSAICVLVDELSVLKTISSKDWALL